VKRAKDLAARIRGVRLLLLDVDGVLTDGGILYIEGGAEVKRFDIHDGMGMDLLMRAGVKVGILTGRTSEIVERRARELGMAVVKQGYYDKSVGLDLILAEQRLTDAEVGYVGDDVQDLSVMRRVGFRAAPANAVEEVKAVSDYVCARAGGDGAVREVIDLILATLGLKEKILREFTSPGVKPPPGRVL
jgi:3-deoxy-D-manno-octulosonate 8-phosphate phosphatase (KDO 8-P phosphatase)